MTTISLMTTDQLLTVAEQPKLAAGDQNSVALRVDFCSEWDGFAKSAVFFTDKNDTIYEVVMLDAEECVIPHEVLAEAGLLYIGVRGVNTNDSAVKTSTLVKYKIDEGAPEGTGTSVVPSASEYQQLLKLAGETRQIAQDVRDDFEAGAIPALQEQNKKEGFMFWVGTTEEYNAQKDSLPTNTYCIITDDTSKAEMLADIAALKEMQGVELGTAPIQHDVHEFDYFVAVRNYNSETYIWTFDNIKKDSSALDLYAYCREHNVSSNITYDRELHFYWGNGGYMVDAIQRLNGASNTSGLAYDKIYGFKRSIKAVV